MGYKELDIRIPLTINDIELKYRIGKKARVKKFTYQIVRKSLDARNKKQICWQYRIGILSEEIKEGNKPAYKTLEPEFRKKNKHIVIIGSGPAGLFAALYLLQCGFRVSILERGGQVEKRKQAINNFESSGRFDPQNNYAFGEGGAGTFSDGKLTSRTKSISEERNFIFEAFIKAGAPREIHYMTHPHLGTDKLFVITGKLRRTIISLGGSICFDTRVTDLKLKANKVISCESTKGTIEGDEFIFATGHSSFETYRMLIRRGVAFQSKNFALGFRAEHSQELINLAQWGVPRLPGIKAAEYRLTAETKDKTPVYSFCMCPGGKVVPATPYAHTNLVNGMSNYQRDSRWANAAVVAGINLEKMFGRTVSAAEALDWLEQLESSFFRIRGDYRAPACTIRSFLNNHYGEQLPESSYPFPLFEADFSELLPPHLIPALRQGLQNFCSRLSAYDTGIIIGLESKTSSPIQVERDPETFCSAYKNLYIAGEGSGRAGGIVSSAADGLRVAQRIAEKRD